MNKSDYVSKMKTLLGDILKNNSTKQTLDNQIDSKIKILNILNKSLPQKDGR